MLLADCHEPTQIMEGLRGRIPVKMLRLKYGDYSFSDTIIERKTLSDFFSSIKSGRLKPNLEDASRFYSENYLLLEGFFDFSYVVNIDYIYSTLTEIAINFDTRFVFSKNPDASVDIITRLYNRRYSGDAPGFVKRDKLHDAARLFGISRRKTESLFREFGSVKCIANAGKRRLREISSIGKVSAGKIMCAMEKNFLDDGK